MNTIEMLDKYKDYLAKQGYKDTTGTIVSYCNAMKYVCDYLKLTDISYSNLTLISVFLDKIYFPTSKEYLEFENYLTRQGKTSYLVKGFIKASGKQFLKFLNGYSFTKNINFSTNAIDNVEKEDSDDDYQADIEKQAFFIKDFSFEFKEKPEYVETAKGKKVKRNPEIARNVLIKENYTCEIESLHKTFISKRTGNEYMEAHHLIPCTVKNNELFYINYGIKLDIPENIICLCPVCHRAMHYGDCEIKRILLNKILNAKMSDFERIGLKLTLDEILKFYI